MFTRIALGAAAAIGLAAYANAAFAADATIRAVPVSAPSKFNWSGFYAGGTAGCVCFSRSLVEVTTPGVPACREAARARDSRRR